MEATSYLWTSVFPAIEGPGWTQRLLTVNVNIKKVHSKWAPWCFERAMGQKQCNGELLSETFKDLNMN